MAYVIHTFSINWKLFALYSYLFNQVSEMNSRYILLISILKFKIDLKPKLLDRYFLNFLCSVLEASETLNDQRKSIRICFSWLNYLPKLVSSIKNTCLYFLAKLLDRYQKYFIFESPVALSYQIQNIIPFVFYFI